MYVGVPDTNKTNLVNTRKGLPQLRDRRLPIVRQGHLQRQPCVLVEQIVLRQLLVELEANKKVKLPKWVRGHGQSCARGGGGTC